MKRLLTLAAGGWLVDCIATPISAFSQALVLRNDAPESIVFETHGDGTVDRATLVDNGEALDLNIFVGDNTTHDPSRKRHQFLPRNASFPMRYANRVDFYPPENPPNNASLAPVAMKVIFVD